MRNVSHDSNFGEEPLEPRLTSLFVKAVTQHDKAAMDEFLSLALPALTERVARWCDKRGFSCGFAEIVASVTLLKALGKANTFEREKCGGKVMVWLVGIARRELAECYRVAKRISDRESGGKDDELKQLPDRSILTPLEELVRREDELYRKRQRELLDAAIRTLPELKRQVVELYRSGMCPGVIAVAMGLAPARVYKLLFDAKKELRRRLA